MMKKNDDNIQLSRFKKLVSNLRYAQKKYETTKTAYWAKAIRYNNASIDNFLGGKSLDQNIQIIFPVETIDFFEGIEL